MVEMHQNTGSVISFFRVVRSGIDHGIDLRSNGGDGLHGCDGGDGCDGG